MAMSVKQDIRFRVYLAFLGICLFGCAILVKAALINIKEGPQLKHIARQMRTRLAVQKANRGNIYTEKGVLLSSSIPEFDIHIDFESIAPDTFKKYVDTLTGCVANLLKDKSQEEYRQEFIQFFNDGERYYLLGRKLSYSQYATLKTFPIFNKSKGYNGLSIETKERRENPLGYLAYRTIGVVHDGVPSSGIEERYNKYLSGVNGKRIEQGSVGSVWIPVEGSEIDPKNGQDVMTTLDMNIQDVAEHALMSVLQQYECINGTCIVMEVATGKVRTLVNLGRQKDGSYAEDLNYAMMPSEPGSTFKLATLIALLNDNLINVDDLVDTHNGVLKFGNRTMKDTHGLERNVPIWKAFAESSNTSMAWLAYLNYKDNPEKFIQNLKRLHLNDTDIIDLKGNWKPYIKSANSKYWSNTTLPWMATGYEVLISPLHTCMLYNGVANNGKLMRPYLVSSINEYGKQVQVMEPKVLVEKMVEPKAVAQLQKCLRAVVTDGTASNILSPFYSISGKTGTAKVADGHFQYADDVYQGSFVGFFPSEQPKYTVCVVIRTKPHSEAYYGGKIAAPVFKMVADKLFSANIGAFEGPLDSLKKYGNGKLVMAPAPVKSYSALLRALHSNVTAPDSRMNVLMAMHTDTLHKAVIKPTPVYKNVMPNVVGMGLRDAVYLLESNGMQVHVQGRGRVNNQSVPAGTRINKGQNIIIQLG